MTAAVLPLSVKEAESAEPVKDAFLMLKVVANAALEALKATVGPLMLLMATAAEGPSTAIEVTPDTGDMSKPLAGLWKTIFSMFEIRPETGANVVVKARYKVSVPAPPLMTSAVDKVLVVEVVLAVATNESLPAPPVKLSRPVVSDQTAYDDMYLILNNFL